MVKVITDSSLSLPVSLCKTNICNFHNHYASTIFIIIVVILIGRRPQHAVSKLACFVLSSARSCRSSICPSSLSTAWLVSIDVFSCHNYGIQVVTHEVHRSSLRRLMCPAQDDLMFLTLLIISMTFVLSLTQMLVFLSLYVILSMPLSILVCEAASLFCACLVSVQVSALYVIAGSTRELYICLFRQMARLLSKISCVFGVCRPVCHDSSLYLLVLVLFLRL